MDLIRVSIVSYTADGERLVASASKLSLSRKQFHDILGMSREEVEKWIIETWRRQHFSPWEHSTYTWVAEGCSRVCTHQLVRHRIASYTQQSMRYTESSLREMALKAASALGLECPKSPKGSAVSEAYKCYSRALESAAEHYEAVEELAKTAYVFPPSLKGEARKRVARQYVIATASYYELLSMGVPREDARFTIPMAVRTSITVTMNARELAESFLPLRLCTRAQWEIKRVAWLLWLELSRIHPLLFKWTGPRCVFMENALRDKPAELTDLVDGRVEFTIPRCPELVPKEGIRNCILYGLKSSGVQLSRE